MGDRLVAYAGTPTFVLPSRGENKRDGLHNSWLGPTLRAGYRQRMTV